MTPTPHLSFGALLRTYARPFWREIALLVLLTLGSNILVVTQPVVLAAMLAAILGPSQNLPAGHGNLFDLSVLGSRVLHWMGSSHLSALQLVALLGGLYLIQSVLASAIEYGTYLLALRIKAGATTRLQEDFVRHLLSLDLRFFQRQKGGELLSRLTNDAVNTAQGLGPLIRALLHHTVQLICYSLYLMNTSLWLTAAAGGIIASHFLLTQALKRPIRTRARQAYDAQGDLSTVTQELLTDIRVAKSFGAERLEFERASQRIRHVAAAVFRHGRVEKLEMPVRDVLDAAGLIGIVVIAAIQVQAGRLTAQGLLLYVYVGRLMITPANHLATAALWVQALLASSERLGELFAERPTVIDGTVSSPHFLRAIALRDVCFSYDGRRNAVDRVTLEIRKGEMVALVGPSGAGKSTLVDLVLRLYDPDHGEVLLDGMNLKTLKQADYRRLFGVVPQECLLFHETVRNNIRFGRSVSDEAIVRAATLANAHAFIARLPHGYDTIVGDRGVRLSGGERQRLAIARALVHHPQLLILDEATSALDSEAEQHVQAAIEQITRQSTTIVIAHRLSTILRADCVVVMDNGRLIDQGRHHELWDRCALYRKCCQLQRIGPEEAETASVDALRTPLSS